MSSRNVYSRLLLVLTMSAAAIASNRALAVEDFTPYCPGVTTGLPSGTLPPQGLFFKDNAYTVWGSLHDGSGNTVPVRVSNTVDVPQLIYVPDLHILGAQYAMSALALYAIRNTDTTGIGGRVTMTSGFFNPIVSPLLLSWTLGHGLFVSSGLWLYIKGGDYRHDGNTTSQDSYANNFWTFEPSVGISYLESGWNLSLNTILDFNTKNHTTDYHSGDAVYFDGTVSKAFGAWTVGLIGNYSKQFTDDKKDGVVVGEDGNRFEHEMLGGMVSYQFGKAKLSLRYLAPVLTRNDINTSFVHLTAAFPLF